MKPYHEKLEGGYRLVRIRNQKRLVYLFLFFLTILVWAYIWVSGGAGLKPFYAPFDLTIPWLLVMLLMVLGASFAFRDLEIRYAKKDSQRFLMAKNSQRRAFWTIVIAAIVMVIFLLPQTASFASDEFSTRKQVRVNAASTLVVDFPNQDSLGLLKSVSFEIGNLQGGSLRVVLFKDRNAIVDDVIGAGSSLPPVSVYTEGDRFITYKLILNNSGGVGVDLTMTTHVKLASSFTIALPVIMVVFIVLNAAWYIRLMPIREKYASASIYSIDYAQQVGSGEETYTGYDVRSMPSGPSMAREIPPPPETFLEVPPPSPEVPAAGATGEQVPQPAVQAPAPVAMAPRREFDIFIEDGSKLFAEGDFEGALRNFESALALEPSNISTWLARSNSLAKLGRSKEALDSFNKVLSAESSNEMALHSKSRILVELKQWSEAVKTLDTYLQLRPADADSLSVKGDALMAMGRRQDAALAFETAYNLKPDDPDLKAKLDRARLDVASLLSKAMVSTASGNYETALTHYEEILRHEPTNARALLGKAGVLRRLGRKEEAIAALTSVLSVDPDNPGALLERTKMLMEEGRTAEAFESSDRFVKVSPEDARGWVLRGDSLSELERFEEALESYRRAFATEVGSPEIKDKIDVLAAKMEGIAQGSLSRALDEVKGIGPAKVKALYDAGFKTVADLKKATVDELNQVKGISRKLAEEIVEHFRATEGGPPQPPAGQVS